jgi:hypothetical protein
MTTSVGDLDALPALNAGAAAKMLGITLVVFNKLVRGGVIVPLSGRRNAYSVKGAVAGYLAHLADSHLTLSEMARHLDISSQRLSKLVNEGVIETAVTPVTGPACPILSILERPRSAKPLPAPVMLRREPN